MKRKSVFLDTNFRHVLNVVFFLLGDSRSSEMYLQTFCNTLFHLDRRCKQEEGTEMVFRKLANKIQTPGNHPKKEYNKTVFVLYCVCAAVLLNNKTTRSKQHN